MECYRTIDFRSEPGTQGFEPNQQVSLNRIKINGDWFLHVQSKQNTSTPGVILKDFCFPVKKNPSGKYCLEVTGRANCNKAFVQVIDPETGQRQINGYQYLPQTLGTFFINFQLSKGHSGHSGHSGLSGNTETNSATKKYHLAILLGGTEKPAIDDQFWIKKIALTNKDLIEQPTALHQQEVLIKREYDPVPQFQWINPIPIVKSNPVVREKANSGGLRTLEQIKQLAGTPTESDSPKVIQIQGTNLYLSLESNGLVKWFQKN